MSEPHRISEESGPSTRRGGRIKALASSDQLTLHSPIVVLGSDAAVRTLFCHALEQAGFDTIETATAREALDAVSTHRVAAVVIDDDNPAWNSPMLVRSLRDNSDASNVPVMLIKGGETRQDRIDSFAAGASDYLAKPVQLSDLVQRVKAHLNKENASIQLIQEHLRARMAIAQTLGQISPASSPELTADVICFELSLLRGLSTVAVLGFEGDDVIVTLAQHGRAIPGIQAGRPVAQPLVDRLFEQAEYGAWMDRFGVEARSSGSALQVAAAAVASPGPFAIAPMQMAGDLLGLLVLGSEADESSGQVTQTLSAAIDFAVVASELLGPGLRLRGRHQARRATLDRVIENGDFHPVFQPIVDLEHRQIVGYELLTRFSDGTRPDIRFAEASGLGVGIDLEIVTLQAGLQLTAYLPHSNFLSINISPSLLLCGDPLLELISMSTCPLVLELTEHDRIDDYDEIKDALARLGPNTKLSIDDAGAGFASLRHVLALEPDFVKLDHSWITGLGDDPARQALVAGIEYFASEAGCRLIAEGIESERDLTALQKLDVELGQGFFLGRPQEFDLL